ncbi:cyanamide hydratase [Microbacterium barkeri]|uniref:Cyanamide hydratase n=1 Tax=Microbacterium barkeri TaxID=33917 RepID=A0A9W6H2E5_9MICO|nr:HD domain-containing protein [Microbacterium barkeri]MDR6877431.1 hypothetical protein [Microbacterium barkeri]GLJ61337.1 cyanamide hydratase [Microbacterium barkeri]
MSPAQIDALIAPPTPVAARAREVLEAWSPPELVRHCLRSWVWASTLGDALGLPYDAELLYVATMLHDLGLVAEFDADVVPFEAAGGAAGWAFAAGAGWPRARRERVQEIIVRHMWTAVDPDEDVESHLLEVATSLDVSGVAPEKWDAALLVAVESHLPRGAFSTDFAQRIHDQAERKPTSSARRLDASGRIDAGARTWERLVAPHGSA